MDNIIRRLTYVQSNVQTSSSLNLTDINVHAENFFRDLLNLVLGTKLSNINIDESNAAAIDLGDGAAKLAVQVTSTNDFAKLKKTVDKFNKMNLHTTYDQLRIFIIGKRKNYKAKTIGSSSKCLLDVGKDVWDIPSLTSKIGDMEIAAIQSVSDFLDAQVPLAPPPRVEKEVQTFESLIVLLSDEAHPSAGKGFLDAPDPDGKINQRFSEHADALTAEFQDLYGEYGEVLRDVRENSEIGQTKLRRLSLYLKSYSDNELTNCDGDPKKALNNLVDSLRGFLAGKGVDCDVTAVRFFLVDELVKCNVFPNKEAINA
jgi:hypothetical protein